MIFFGSAFFEGQLIFFLLLLLHFLHFFSFFTRFKILANQQTKGSDSAGTIDVTRTAGTQQQRTESPTTLIHLGTLTNLCHTSLGRIVDLSFPSRNKMFCCYSTVFRWTICFLHFPNTTLSMVSFAMSLSRAATIAIGWPSHACALYFRSGICGKRSASGQTWHSITLCNHPFLTGTKPVALPSSMTGQCYIYRMSLFVQWVN